MFERGRILFEELEDYNALIGAYTDLGYCYLNLKGQVDKSLECLKLGYKIAKENHHKNIGLILGDLGLGVYYTFIGKYEKGDNYIKKSIENSMKTEIQGLYSLASRFLAESLLLQGKYEESLSFYEKSYDIAIQTDMILWNFGSLIGIAINRKKLGLKMDYDDVLQKKDKFYQEGNWYEYWYDYLQYLLFEEDRYLHLAYDRLNDISNKLNAKDRKKLLKCPWPKIIIAEWEKLY